MRYLSRLQLVNFKCYAGDQTICLEPKAYSVVARRAEDPESSNWAGKSTLLQAVRFVLHGEHEEETEDGWITRGADDGAVHAELVGDRRAIVSRSRRRGKSTQLEVEVPEGGEHGRLLLKGADAQAYIDGHVGLSREDFPHTCYFRQRQMARMVLARPAERLEVVGAWLRMEKLADAEAACLQDLNQARARHAGASRRYAQHKEQLGAAANGRSRDAIQSEESDAAARLLGYKKELDHLVSEVETARELAATRVRVEEYDRLAADGKALAEELRGKDVALLAGEEERVAEEEKSAALALAAAVAREQQCRQVALGQFDGACPVAGIRCPATEEINAQGKRGRLALASAQEVTGARREEHAKAQGALSHARARYQEARRSKDRLDGMRDRIRAFHGEYKGAKKRVEEAADPGETERRMVTLSHEVQDQVCRREALNRTLEAVDAAVEAMGKARVEVEAGERELATCREARAVYRQAQRRVAELSMRQVEDGANDLLRECGIDLSLQVRWSREGEGLAKACDECGAPFPASAKVKACECGAPRGQNQVRRLDIVLSDRSGAAEDLAGAAFQLSASAWLREDRGSAWSAALLDEPFSQLDPSNRRAFATHLAAMLSGRYGFSQAFVVSHSPDTVSMLPGRIEITSEGGRAKVRVA